MNFKNPDTHLHVKGKSIFIDDMEESQNMLHAAVFYSPVAHGKIRKLHLEEAKASKGVVAILTAKDIPGENQIGGIIPDESLLAEDHVLFYGEPIAIVLATTRRLARRARRLIKVDIDELPAILDPREAYEKGELIAPERTFVLGNVDCFWDKCDLVVEGSFESGGQEHFYMETQCAVAYPQESGDMKIISSTQSPTVVQKAAARVLGVPLHRVEVELQRMGGAFGGKEDQATAWAVMAALAANNLQRPVKLVLARDEDLAITGKRHPYSSDYKMGLTKDGEIVAYQAMFYQNSGAVADLSTSILERTLFHATNAYYVPHVQVTAAPCRTNLHPYTAFRGFGGPQGMFVIEAAIQAAAEKLGMPAWMIQEKNLLKEKDQFSYGMYVENCQARRCWEEAKNRFNLEKTYGRVKKFNETNTMKKKGVAMMPICFGISFTTIFLNQAGALVHVYQDGSVSVSTGATEMGQGVNMKILKIVAQTLSVDYSLVNMETTNTSRVANTSPTAASSGADMNGKAAQLACQQILTRLRAVAASCLKHNNPDDIEVKDGWVYCEGEKSSISWAELVRSAYLSRVNLSAYSHFAVPNIHFDKTPDIEKGVPFSYHVFGTAMIETTVDCLRGTYEVDAVHLVHDIGRSIDELIDEGQVFGALIQGIGWVTMEELKYSEQGIPLVDSASKYKIPDIKFTPKVMDLHFLGDADNPYAVLNSKAVGEPPFMYGIGAYFAIASAMKAFRPEKPLLNSAPVSTQKVLPYLYD